MALTNVHIVLSRPSEPRNIGASCRAMKNAGIRRLTIVSESPIDFTAAQPLAVDARDVLEGARVVPDLQGALAGSAIIAGVTRRTGQRRKLVSFAPWQLAERVLANRDDATISIVFGNEQSGLTDAELEHCHMAVCIPSHPDFPSLNLSHAVQVIVYELYAADQRKAAAAAAAAAPGHQAITNDELAGHIAIITSALENLGYRIQDGPQGMRTFLTDILGRAMLSEPEVKRLSSLFAKLDGMHRARPGDAAG